MKSFLLAILLSSFFYIIATAQVIDSTLDVVNWNVEWFGSNQNGPTDKTKQEQNVIKVLRYLDADIFALSEIVDTTSLRRVVNALGTDYGFFISPYCSLAGSTLDADWVSGQKLVFIYKKSVFSNIKVEGLLRNSGAAYTNFASGRYPYSFTANTRINNKVINIQFILIHGKSGVNASDYFRRRDACDELKDSLDASAATKPIIILGDYNDDLDVTIANNTPTASSYNSLVRDSTDNNSYHSITLPLSYMGKKSTISYNDMIDHQVISNELLPMYVKGSAAVRTDVTAIVPDYNNRNTSDHYPISSKFIINNGDTTTTITPNPTSPTPSLALNISVWPNPFSNFIIIRNNAASNISNIRITTLQGLQVYNSKTVIGTNSTETITLPSYLAPGVYFLHIYTTAGIKVIKLQKLP